MTGNQLPYAHVAGSDIHRASEVMLGSGTRAIVIDASRERHF